MSRITSPWPMISALAMAEKMEGVGANRVWIPARDNKLQPLFLERYYETLRGQAVELPEIQSIVSKDAAEINRFLKERGFNIRLENFGPGGFGTASVLDLLLRWIVEGQKIPIQEFGTGKEYPGVRIKGENATFFRCEGHRHPIACLRTKTDDLVMMTIAPRVPRDEFDLMDMIERIEATKEGIGRAFGGVQFPMVDLQQEVDISWILGLSTTGEDGLPCIITQALMEAIARINHKGVRVKIAVAYGIERCCLPAKPKPDMIINEPLLFWIVRPGLERPLVYAYITQEEWKEPEDIEG